MKHPRAAASFATFLFLLLGFAIPCYGSEAASVVSIKLSAEKKVYTLGEVVSIESRIKNNTSKTIEFGGDNKSWVVVRIAFGENGPYLLYVGASFGFSIDGIRLGVPVSPGKTLVQKEELLWNYMPRVSGLSPEAARTYTEGRILTDLAFPRAGKYFIQLHSRVVIGDTSADYRSKPVEIEVVEPQGDDASVWNMINENTDIAHFIQYAKLPNGRYFKSEERDRFQLLIQNLVAASPNGRHATRLSRSLHLFRLAEMERVDLKKSLSPKINRPTY